MTTIREIFEKSSDRNKHNILLKEMENIFNNTEIEDFYTSFKRYLNVCLLVFKREPIVEYTLKFVVKFLKSQVPVLEGDHNSSFLEEDENQNVEVNIPPLLEKVIQHLIKFSDHTDKAIRFRCVHMVHLILSEGLGDIIYDDLYEKLYNAILTRLKDKIPQIRLMAVKASTKLQLADADCSITKAYYWLIRYDTPLIRFTILKTMVPCNESLKFIVERIRDTDSTVRLEALRVIVEKVPKNVIELDMRIDIIKTLINDNSDIVKKACELKLLPKWLNECDGSLYKFADDLDFDAGVEVAVKLLMRDIDVNSLVRDFGQLNSGLLIDLDKITVNAAHYWYLMCSHLAANYPDKLEKVLPSLSIFTQYCSDYFNQGTATITDNDEDSMDFVFIMEKLLRIVMLMDFTEEAGRMHLVDFVSRTLTKAPLIRQFIVTLCDVFRSLYVYDEANYIEKIIELLTNVIHTDTTLKTLTEINEKFDRLITRRDTICCDIENAQLDNNTEDCSEWKKILLEVQNELERLQVQRDETRDQSILLNKNSSDILLKSTLILISMGLTVKKLNADVLPKITKYLNTFILPAVASDVAMVRQDGVKALCLVCIYDLNTARNYLFLLNEIQRTDSDMVVRINTTSTIVDILLTYGLSEFSKIQVTKTNFAKYKLNKRLASDRNLSLEECHISPVANYRGCGEQGDEGDEEYQEVDVSLMAINHVSNKLFDNKSEVRFQSVEGMLKLLMNDRFRSIQLLARIIILWHSEQTSEDKKLRSYIAAFLPMFTFSNRNRMELMSRSFIIAMQMINDAKGNDPVCNINQTDICKMYYQLTDIRHLGKKSLDTPKPDLGGGGGGDDEEDEEEDEDKNDNGSSPASNAQSSVTSPFHTIIADSIIEALLENTEEEDFVIRSLSKFLKTLRISFENTELIDNMISTESNVKKLKEKKVVADILKFIEYLKKNTNHDINCSSDDESRAATTSNDEHFSESNDAIE